MLNLIIFGPPGAGKGTQAQLIAEKYSLHHLSSGEVLRAEVKGGALKNEVEHYLNAGLLVPDDLIIRLIEARVEKLLSSSNLIFDGYPRTLRQAESLDELFSKEGVAPAVVISLLLDETEATKRILLRGQHSGRTDDNLTAIQERFRIYHQETDAVIDYYQKQNRVIKIDGSPDIATVNSAINEVVDKLLVRD